MFLVDVSGSMCTSLEVTPEVAESLTTTAGDGTTSKSGVQAAAGDAPNQRLPRQSRGVAYVSRLQCVQAAIARQVRQIAKESPGTKVGLVTFSDEVTVHGDCMQGRDQKVVSGDKLGDLERLDLMVPQISSTLVDAVSKSGDSIVRRVRLLEENGQTALGPALLLSIGIAGRCGAGSTVVVCTDGLSNRGLGSVDQNSEDEKALAASAAFYQMLGTRARDSGVRVNVVSIGASCRLEELGKVSDVSSGVVSLVDPVKLSSEVVAMLQEDVVATSVEATLILHRALEFCDVDLEEGLEVSSVAGVPRAKKVVGNAVAASVVAFEYQVKKLDPPVALASVPFQLQVRYKRISDGMPCVRVVTKTQPLTEDRNEAMREAEVAVLGTHVAQKAARLAQKGDYTMARAVAWTNKNFMKEVVQNQAAPEQQQQQQQAYCDWKQQANGLEHALSAARQKERRRGLVLSASESSGSDEDDMDVDEVAAPSPAAVAASKPKKAKKRAPVKQATDEEKQVVRAMGREDEIAQHLFQMRHYSSKKK